MGDDVEEMTLIELMTLTQLSMVSLLIQASLLHQSIRNNQSIKLLRRALTPITISLNFWLGYRLRYQVFSSKDNQSWTWKASINSTTRSKTTEVILLESIRLFGRFNKKLVAVNLGSAILNNICRALLWGLDDDESSKFWYRNSKKDDSKKRGSIIEILLYGGKLVGDPRGLKFNFGANLNKTLLKKKAQKILNENDDQNRRKIYLIETFKRFIINYTLATVSIIGMVLLGSSHSSMSQSLKAFPTLEFLNPWIISLFGGTLVWTILDLIGCSVRFYRISSDKLFEQLQKIFHVDEQKKDKDCHEGAQGKKIEGGKNSSGELSTVVGEDEEDEFWFDRPYLSNSLRDFWSNRWHSQLKQIFVEFGSNPIQYLSINLLGIRSRNLLRILRVFGAFFISGLFHELGLWYATKLDKKLNNLKFFTMQAVGIVLESLFEKIFCKQVGGFYGRIWSLGWVLLWGRLMIFSYIDHKVIDLDLIYLGLFKEDYEFQGGVRGGTTYLFGKTLEFYLLNPILIRVLF